MVKGMMAMFYDVLRCGEEAQKNKTIQLPLRKAILSSDGGSVRQPVKGQVLPCSHSFQLYNCIVTKFKKSSAFTELPQYSTWIRSTKSPQ